MDRASVAAHIREDRHDEAAGLIEQYTIPLVTSLTEDVMLHDLAVTEILAGSFLPAGARVMIDVDASFAFLGWARAALLLYVGQPETPGTRLYDSGGQPVADVQVYPVGSVNGESAWAATTHRRLVLDVDPSRPVTWQVLPAIIGASATVEIPAPLLLTITPDGTMAFVSSPTEGLVTPVQLGRPGYSYKPDLRAMDQVRTPVTIEGSPTYLSSNDRHVVVSNVDAVHVHVSVLSVVTGEIEHEVSIPGGEPLGSAISPDGHVALVGTATGKLARIDLATGAVESLDLGGRIVSVGIVPDGSAAFAADAAGRLLHRVVLPELTVDASASLAAAPHVVRVAPDGQVWVACRPASDADGRLVQVDPTSTTVTNDYTLPYPEPSDLAIVPVDGQTVDEVRTAWLTYEGDRFSQVNIGGVFAGEVHSIHRGALEEGSRSANAIAVSDYGEIWMVRPGSDHVWKWPGGRFLCRADRSRLMNGAFFGEYLDVAVYGAKSQPERADAQRVS
jgi:hypothetical protein